MSKTAFGLFLAICGWAVSAVAQSLTPEQLQAMIDERLNQQNPYEAILTDPDPERSLAAMEIMIDSGDPELVSMALEFGLLSPNPAVRRIAVERYFDTQPVLAAKFDGSQASSERSFRTVVEAFNGTLDQNNIGYAQIGVGPRSDDGLCFLEPGRDTCRITINSTGVFLTAYTGNSSPWLTARLTLNDSGQFVALANNFDNTLPVTIQILD
jgi:hypothetical protein